MKIGVTSHKLGIMKDKETWTDQRMFAAEGTIVQYRVGGQAVKVEDQQ
jgi:hypothetical protein